MSVIIRSSGTRPRVPIRICYAPGPWQIITLAASLAAHRETSGGREPAYTVLALGGTRGSDAMRSTMEAFVAACDEFDEVCWIEDLASELRSLDDTGLQERLRTIQRRAGAEAADELWLSNPHVGPARLLLESFPAARLFIYEDGLLTYARPWDETEARRMRAVETLRDLGRRIRRDPHTRVEAMHVEVRMFGRRPRMLGGVYLILSDVLGVPRPYRSRARTVRPDLLRLVIDRLTDVVPTDSPVGDSVPTALVLGSTFSLWKVMTREREMELYAEAIDRIARAGYRVVWKDHPRMLEPFLPELRARLPDLDLLAYSDNIAVPLELLLRRNPVDLLVAAMSTSLFYAPLVTAREIRVATFAESVRPHLTWPRLAMVDLVRSAVPDLDEALHKLPQHEGA